MSDVCPSGPKTVPEAPPTCEAMLSSLNPICRVSSYSLHPISFSCSVINPLRLGLLLLMPLNIYVSGAAVTWAAVLFCFQMKWCSAGTTGATEGSGGKIREGLCEKGGFGARAGAAARKGAAREDGLWYREGSYRRPDQYGGAGVDEKGARQ